MKFRVGDEGPELITTEGVRVVGSVRVMEPVRPTEGLREEDPEEGKLGTRGGGCCRMRRRPDAPRPCSCSVMTGDLIKKMVRICDIYTAPLAEIRDIGGLCLSQHYSYQTRRKKQNCREN